VLDVLFQHTTSQHHWGSWHIFFDIFCKFNACAVLIYCFRFLAWTFNRKMSSLCLDVFVLFWGGEPAGKLQVKHILLRNVVIKNGLLTLAHALLTFCSRFAHALLTRFAHALLTLAEVPFESFRFLLSPYEVPFGSLRGSAHDLLTVCLRFAHGLLTVCSRCSRFAHVLGHDVSMLMKTPISKPCHFFVVPSHVYLRPTASRLQTPWG